MLTHHQLFQEVWGPSRADNYHYLRIYMGHLRQKLECDPAQPEHIVTESGVGYRLIGVEDLPAATNGHGASLHNLCSDFVRFFGFLTRYVLK